MTTFVTSWYIVKAKFNKEIYQKWLSYFLTNVKNFNLVIFTNKESVSMITPYIQNNDNIRVILYEWNEFSTYHLKDKWMNNHSNNNLLNTVIHWKLNMLWSEKINMVKIVKDSLFFASDFIGWCDIGYFRCRPGLDIDESEISNWPNSNKIKELDINKIYYCKVCNSNTLNHLAKIILTKNEYELPYKPIPSNQISIAGGFFITNIQNIDWWHSTFYDKLNLYFQHNYLVKDDQIIVIDCIINNLKKFKLIEQKLGFDRWFGFQTYLS